MSKSTKTSKIRFSRIRQSKTDYIKHFLQVKLGLVSSLSFAFIFGGLLVLNIGSAMAQPTATPPNGAVTATFNNLGVIDKADLPSTTIRGALTIDGISSSNRPSLRTTSTFPLQIDTDIQLATGKNIILGANSSIFFGTKNDEAGVKIEDRLSVSSLSVANTALSDQDKSKIIISGVAASAANAKTNANAGLDLRGRTDVVFGLTKIRCAVENYTFGGERHPCLSFDTPVHFEKKVEIKTDLDVRGNFGDYKQVYGTRSNLSAGFEIAGAYCPDTYRVVSCNGQLSNTPDYAYLGSVMLGEIGCTATAGKRTTNTTTTANLQSAALCFRSYK